MADNPIRYGFRWSYNANGGRNPPLVPAIIATSQSFDINGGASNVSLRAGDPVTLISTGGVNLCDGSEGAGGGVALYGIVAKVLPYWDATTERMVFADAIPSDVAWGTILERQSKVLVIPADAGVFEIDCDDAATATTEAAYQAFIGENCDHILTAASGTKATPRLDISGHGTATAQWRIVSVSDTRENMDFSGNYVKVDVRVNEAPTQLPAWGTTGI